MRGLSAGMQTAITDSTLRPVFLVRLEFGTSLILYLNDRSGPISWDGQTWQGNGWLRPIKSVVEVSEVQSTGCQITLSGTIAELRAYALAEARLSNVGKIWLGLLNSTNQLIADPYLVFSGKLDIPVITSNENEMTIDLSYESDLRGLERANEFRFTDQSQKAQFEGDRGFEYTTIIEQWDGYWGRPERPKWLRFKRSK